MNQPDVVPIARRETRECTITPPWFVQGSEYNILPGRFELLINGENAFRAIYEAIAQATKSVSIICWGFQPSMRFLRGKEIVAVGVLLDALDRLAGMLGHDAIELVADRQDVLGVDGDIRCLALEAAQWLVNHYPGIG